MAQLTTVALYQPPSPKTDPALISDYGTFFILHSVSVKIENSCSKKKKNF